jgi:hypothetical protein
MILLSELSLPWPLLMDAVNCANIDPEMVECLLTLKADPNYKSPIPCLNDTMDSAFGDNSIEESYYSAIS